MLIQRYLEESVRGDLEEKMVFLSGPRQVGKTTFKIKACPGGSGGTTD
jgi:predicted AAA+ superfamily ATPase